MLCFFGNKFIGFIFVSIIGDFDQFCVLSLYYNGFMGLFLVDFLRCIILQGIFLGYNFFLGFLLDFIGVWLCLIYFNVVFNNFLGEIFVFIFEFRMLIELDLQGNVFLGKLLVVLVVNLVRFLVVNNKFEGFVLFVLQNFMFDSFFGNDGFCGLLMVIFCFFIVFVFLFDVGVFILVDEFWLGDGF